MIKPAVLPQGYTKNVVMHKGQWWYVMNGVLKQPIVQCEQRNKGRMFVREEMTADNPQGYIHKGKGKEPPHPYVLLGYHTPGVFKTWDEALNKINSESFEKGKSTEGYVYVINCEGAYDGWLKIGCTRFIERRLSALNTGSPFRDYKCLHMKFFSDRHFAEGKAHKAAKLIFTDHDKQNGEWFKMSVEQAIDIIDRIEE